MTEQVPPGAIPGQTASRLTPGDLRGLAARAQELADELRDLAGDLDRDRATRPAAPVPLPVASRGERIWFTTAQAAVRADCHPTTVLKACESGELHGSQRKANGRWRIHLTCLDAWVAGANCEHQEAPSR